MAEVCGADDERVSWECVDGFAECFDERLDSDSVSVVGVAVVDGGIVYEGCEDVWEVAVRICEDVLEPQER